MSKGESLQAFDPSAVVQTLDRIADLLDGAGERLSGRVRAAIVELWQPNREPPPACVWYTHAVRIAHDKELGAHLGSAAGAVGEVLSGNTTPTEAARRIRVMTGWLERQDKGAALDTATPDDLVTTLVAVEKFRVSRATLKRYVHKGKLRSYRPDKCPRNAQHCFSMAELVSRFPTK